MANWPKYILMSMAVLAASGGLAHGQDWSRYQETTLAQAISKNGFLMEFDYPTLGKDYPLKVRVAYTGEIRDIDADKKHLIALWVKSFGMDPKIAERFQKEMLFLENGATYWLPVQTGLIPAFQEELKSGSCVWLFAQLWGGAKKQFVFVVNEFQAIPNTKCHD